MIMKKETTAPGDFIPLEMDKSWLIYLAQNLLETTRTRHGLWALSPHADSSSVFYTPPHSKLRNTVQGGNLSDRKECTSCESCTRERRQQEEK